MKVSPTIQSGRVGRPKSKTGCNTCKARRVRCGEEKPHCLRCTSTGRKCAYVSTLAPQRIDSPPRQLALFSHQGWRERRAFEYYFHQAGPALSGVLDVAFWRGSVLQICRMEPAIWDAIISLSSLYERPPIHDASPFRLINNPAEVEHSYHREALVWYSRSLAAVQQRIDQGVADLTVSLISCILFIAIELLQGNRKAAMSLTSQGTRMVTRAMTPIGHGSKNRASIDRAILISVIKPIFQRLDTWNLITSGAPSNFNWPLDISPSIVRLTTLDEARNVLNGIVAEMKKFNIDTKQHWKYPADRRLRDAQGLATKQRQLKDSLNLWHESFLSLATSDQDASEGGGTALLLMTYFSVLIEIQTCLDPSQAAYDKFEAEFRQIINYASVAIAATRNTDGHQPPFIFEMGVFLPLFITALKCRFPQLRRQALSLLNEAPPAQGLFMCRPAAHAVAVLVALEEDPSTALEVSGVSAVLAKPGCIPPLQNRIWEFNVSSDMDSQGRTRNWLHFSLRDFGQDQIRFTQNVMLFPGAQP
ncbi:transcriptional regulator family: Fungal Specific TF [Penicillium pulvis]|uniref:transcriptional regulator family: Fungal Specific TF n=1 Tax=Penicillium pulvis TaxID=1562058 RepID=UPI0025491ABA|nr:transcriptional regulator family: Fungal Specific TF [Penicillium pulvis]KAJ5786676.1 transcriptional regulator family: Fungal Specific TF [Penicillium pulvis]